jgi:hypothetical protein
MLRKGQIRLSAGKRKTVRRKTPPNLHILKLTFTWFATGMALYLAAMIMAVRIMPELVQLQSVRHPKGWMLSHLLLLGFATSVAMGASFQITQVILRTSLFSRGLGYVQYVLYMIGFFGLLAGFALDVRLAVAGGGSLAAGAILYAVNLAATFVRKREWNVYVFGVSLSVVALLMAIFFGIAMGLSFASGWNSARHGDMFGSHLWFGVGGWLAGLILVYSFKLLPMFYVSRKKLEPYAYAIVGMFHLGVWLQVGALWGVSSRMDDAGTLLMLIAWGWFVLHMLEVRKLSSGKAPIGAVNIAFWLLPAIGLLFAAWSAIGWAGADVPLALEAFALAVILGWFAGSILSYLSKILPFLWWAHRFRNKEEKKSAVPLPDMLPEKRMTRELYGYLAGVAVVVAGFLLRLPEAAQVGQAAATVFAVVYAAELARVFRY